APIRAHAAHGHPDARTDRLCRRAPCRGVAAAGRCADRRGEIHETRGREAAGWGHQFSTAAPATLASLGKPRRGGEGDRLGEIHETRGREWAGWRHQISTAARAALASLVKLARGEYSGSSK